MFRYRRRGSALLAALCILCFGDVAAFGFESFQRLDIVAHLGAVEREELRRLASDEHAGVAKKRNRGRDEDDEYGRDLNSPDDRKRDPSLRGATASLTEEPEVDFQTVAYSTVEDEQAINQAPLGEDREQEQAAVLEDNGQDAEHVEEAKPKEAADLELAQGLSLVSQGQKPQVTSEGDDHEAHHAEEQKEMEAEGEKEGLNEKKKETGGHDAEEEKEKQGEDEKEGAKDKKKEAAGHDAEEEKEEEGEEDYEAEEPDNPESDSAEALVLGRSREVSSKGPDGKVVKRRRRKMRIPPQELADSEMLHASSDIHRDTPVAHIQVMGLQNTGTNLLTAELWTNFDKYVYFHDALFWNESAETNRRPGIWKHSNIRLSFEYEPEKIAGLNQTGVVPLIMVRNPLSWLKSMRKSPYELSYCVSGRKWLTQKCMHRLPCGVKSQCPRTTFSSLGDIWNQWNSAYTHFNKYGYSRGLVVRYEDLVGSPGKVMKDIAAYLGLPRPEGGWVIKKSSAKTHGSSHGREEALEMINNKEYLKIYSDEERREVCLRLDRDMMLSYGYTDCAMILGSTDDMPRSLFVSREDPAVVDKTLEQSSTSPPEKNATLTWEPPLPAVFNETLEHPSASPLDKGMLLRKPPVPRKKATTLVGKVPAKKRKKAQPKKVQAKKNTSVKKKAHAQKK